MLVDRFGRRITYLRVSVTDRCNLRCVYCMPVEGVSWQAHDSILRYEEIAQIVRLAAENGVREIRLTGGEPLIRKNLADLVAMISAIPGIEDISLTTNGLLLGDQVQRLVDAGLKRINVSLDTLQPEKFSRITRGGNLERVWQGLESAHAAGLAPIKLNVVAMRGINDGELPALARLSLQYPWHVRFIEIMPVKNQQSWGSEFPPPEDTYLSIQEMLKILGPSGLVKVENGIGSGPAHEYRLPGAPGRIGFISPLGEQFCEACNRLRLTADGNLRPCLLHDIEVPIREALRRGEDLLPYFAQALASKPLSHELNADNRPTGRCMMQIGG
jgi:cyclic pyranopterin phosphate synthase